MARIQLRIIVALLAMGTALHATKETIELKKIKLKKMTEQRQPFATHFLLIIAETNEKSEKKGPMVDELNQAFTSNVPFLVTEVLLHSLTRSKKKDLPATYRYFKIPANRLWPQLLLCIPSTMITTVIKPIEDQKMKDWKAYRPETVSASEKRYGLLLEHFQEITESLVVKKDYQLSKDYDKPTNLLGDELRAILTVLFVPNSNYANQEEYPRWILVFSGHGGQYKPYSDAEIIAYHKFIKSYGIICGLDSKNLAKIIGVLRSKITLALLHISTCFGGGINVGNLLYDEETGVLPPDPFIITTQTNTGNSCTTSEEEARYDKFFNLLKDIEIRPTEKILQSIEFWQTEKPDLLTYEPAFKDLYNKIPKALGYITPNYKLYISGYVANMTAIKPAATNYFVEMQLPKRIPLKRIDKNTVKQYKNKTFEVSEKLVLLLYTNTVPFPIQVTSVPDLESLAYITSAIPGSTFHTITEINVPIIKELDRKAIKKIFPDLNIKTSQVTQLFHVKKLSTEKAAYELRIIKEPKSYAALRTSLKKREVFTLFDIDSEKKISALKAAEWIKEFDEKIVFLKKLANAQAPYRFLKDADIETLPWD